MSSPAPAPSHPSSWEPADLVAEAERFLEQGKFRRVDVLLTRALSLDPDCPAARTLQAQVLTRLGEEGAEQALLAAIRLSKKRLGGDEPSRHHWWADPATRPYLKARKQLADLFWSRGRHEEAAVHYQALLERNPGDNQGARYVVGPLYLLAGKRREALAAFERYALDYPEDSGNPHHFFCWVLALFQEGRKGEALVVLRRALFENLYLAPALLGQEVQPLGIWEGSNAEFLDYGLEYVDGYGPLWKRDPRAMAFLKAVWEDEEQQSLRQEVLALHRKVDRLKAPAARRKVFDRIGALVETPWSADFHRRVGIAPASTDPFRPVGEPRKPAPPTEETDPPKLYYPEARKSGAFQKAVEEAGMGAGDFTAKLRDLLGKFAFEDEKEFKQAADAVMKAWNRSLPKPGGTRVALEEVPDPWGLMDQGLEKIRKKDLEDALDDWIQVLQANPGMVDRLLGWDEGDLQQHLSPMSRLEAWEYMNHSWRGGWEEELEAYTTLLALWCRKEVRGFLRLPVPGLGQDLPRSRPEASDLVPKVRRMLEGADGDLFRHAALVFHRRATVLRDLDALDVGPEQILGEEMAELVGLMGELEAVPLLIGADEGPSKQKGKPPDVRPLLDEVEKRLTRFYARVAGGETQEASAPRDLPSALPKVGRNDPCPCGSGKKFKKCCGR